MEAIGNGPVSFRLRTCANITHPLSEPAPFWRTWQNAPGSPRKGRPPPSLIPQAAQELPWLFLSLQLSSGLRAITEDGKTSVSDACLMLSDINTKGLCVFFFSRSNRWQVVQEGKNTSKATHISSCCSESHICLHSLSLICQHKITLNWRDRDWACSTGEQQLLWLICVASQVRLMEMVEIMEHRALKCPLVLYYFLLFYYYDFQEG